MGPAPGPTVTSDAELMRAAQRGDLAAFARLVRRWQPAMLRFLTRLGGRDAEAGDLCQELFLKVYQARARYSEQGTFSAWLYRLALNVARDAQRRQRRQPSLYLDAIDPIQGEPLDSELTRQEEAGLVSQALEELPEPMREVLVLRHYEEMNFEAMSRLLKVPASTLKSRFAVALVRLKDLLLQRGWDPEDEES